MYKKLACMKLTCFPSCTLRCSTVFHAPSIRMWLGFDLVLIGGSVNPHSAFDAGRTCPSLVLLVKLHVLEFLLELENQSDFLLSNLKASICWLWESFLCCLSRVPLILWLQHFIWLSWMLCLSKPVVIIVNADYLQFYWSLPRKCEIIPCLNYVIFVWAMS